MSVAQQQQPVVHTTTQQQQHINHHHHQQQEQHHSSTTTNNQQQLQQEQRQKLLNKRKLVIQEIFQTEKEYVNALETLDNIFITPIKQQQLLKEEDTNELFKDIQIILAVNKEVLSFIDIFIKYMEDHNYNDDDLNNTLNTLNSSNNNGNNSVGGVGSSSVSVGGNTLEVNNNSNNNNNTISPSTPTSGNDFTSSFSNNSQPTTPTTNNTSNTNTNTTNTSNTTNTNSNNNKEIEQKKRNALILGKKITPTLGDIFHLMSDYLKSYSSYCNKYELIFKMIEEKKQKKSKFRKFLERTEFTPDAFNDSIISFMIKPVQRIPRYEMLLRESIKTTPQDHHDYSRLISAAQKINNVASRVNEKIREQLCRERAIQLSQQFNSDQLPFELVKSSRKFIAHTVMGYISDRSGIQMRCFILYNDLILLCNYTGSSNSNSNNNSNNNSNSTSNSTDQMMTQFFNNSNNSNNTSNSNTNNNNTNNLTNITNINETYSNEQKKKEVEIFDNPKVKFHLRCAISLLSTPLIWAESLPDGYCIENAFKLVTRDKTFILFTENKIQRDYWVQLINDQMDKLKKQLPHLNEESNANEIMLVNSRYFYYASGSEKDKRIEMLNSQMSDSSERLKIETSLQQDHLNLIIEQIQKDVDFIDQQCYDHEYVQSMNYLKLQPSHPLSNSHSQHRLSVNSLNNTCVLSPSIDDINNNSNGSGNNLLSNLNSSSASNLITTSAAAAANNSSNSNSSSSISQSKRNSTSIKSLFSGGSVNSNATTPTSSVATSPVSVSHGNSLSLSNLYDHHGAHSPSSSYGSSPPVYLSPSNNALSPSHHQTGHLSASIALRSSSSTSTTTNRDRSNSLYNTRIVIPQQRNSQSPTILKELFQKLNTDFQDQELSTSTSNSTSNNMTTSTSSISSNNSNTNNSNNTNKRFIYKKVNS
ncbi:rhoGEF domain-containing protein [Naegleria gruberi]|uniref:RhoGEF domain-containing protein n=1 Tax=Naegleria gruberi TaxID=5762 RepID=D2VEN0_NAEGR|nr:rhoGEF domain-containing protein [Naegleria gruberi]EFC44529.1 rhoGEF domain-containing protein [Naegleria gruberi]|eukprot:XP_002677273.1 rhoGEF domain-containing protein [Naegleria gruberi strain NEG-M]